MLKHIAVRLKRSSDAEIAFKPNEKHSHKRQLVGAKLEVRDPAVKNYAEALYERGLDYFVDDCKLFWFQIDDANPVDYYTDFNEVECVFDSVWFEEEKNRIRYLQGTKYVDECHKLAERVRIKDQNRKIDYSL